MENRIHQVMELGNGKKYVVIKQDIYKGNNYFVDARLTDDEEDVLEEFVMFEEVEKDGESAVLEVKDPNIYQMVCKYVGLLD